MKSVAQTETVEHRGDRYRSLFEAMSEGFALHEIICDEEGRPCDYRFLEVNPAFERLTGLKAGEVLGKRVREVVPKIEPFWIEVLGRVALTGKPAQFEHASAGLGKHYSVTAYSPKQGQFAALFFEVTEHKHRELELQKANRTLQALSESSQAMLRASNEPEYLGEVCRIVAGVCGHAMVWIGFAQDDEDKSVVPVAWAGFDEGYLKPLQITWADTERGRGPTGTAIRTGTTQVCANMLKEPQFHPWREQAIKRGFASSMALPIMAGGRAIGALSIYSREPDAFSPDEAKLLSKLAEGLSFGITSLRVQGAHQRAELNLKQSEERLQLAISATNDAIWDMDLVNGTVSFNQNFTSAFGNPPDTKNYWEWWIERLHIDDGKRVIASLREAIEGSQRTWIAEYRFMRTDGRWADIYDRAFIARGEEGKACRVVGSMQDVTERRRAERRMNLLAETGNHLLQSASPQEVIDGLCQKVLEFLDCQVFFNYLVDEKRGVLHLNACGGIPKAEAAKIEWLTFGTAVCGCAAKDGCRIVAEDIPHSCDNRTTLVKSFGVQAYACHPLLSGGKVLGTLSFGTLNRTHFTVDELSLMKAVADQVSIAIDRKRAQEALERANDELEKRVEERTAELQQQSRFLEAFFHHSIDGLVFLDKEFNFIRVNEAYARGTGRAVGDFPGRNHFEIYPHEENHAIFQEVVRTCTPYMAIARPFVFPDHPEWGVTYWDWSLVPVLNAEGEVDFLVFGLRDVTKRKRTEQELHAASRYARSLLETSLDPLVTISFDGKIMDVNRATELATGFERAQLVGTDFSNYFTEPANAAAGYQKVLADGLVRDYPLTIRHSSGRTLDVLYNASVYRNEAGEVQGVFAAARDITERKRMESVLEQSESRYRSLVIASAQMIWTTNPEGMVTDDSPTWRQFTGQTLEEIKGTGWTNAVHPHDRKRALLEWRHSVAACSPFETEYRVRRADNQYRHFAIRGVPVMKEDETVREWIGAGTDITEKKEAEAELLRYREDLEVLVKERTQQLENSNEQLHQEIAERKRAETNLRKLTEELARSNRDLEQFAYVASHDLQEPLRAVAGYVGLLQRRCPALPDPKATHYIEGATDGAVRMQRLIEDLLSFSRVQTKGKRFALADLNQALEHALSNLQASIKETEARISAESLPMLVVDASQVTQLFQNLIGNAIKFHSDAAPEIHVSATREHAHWRFSVRDNGIGIEPQYFQRIFQIFQRLHTRRNYAGTGIGLAICKRIVERHNGSIWVESNPDQGSTFHFTIPDKKEVNQDDGREAD